MVTVATHTRMYQEAAEGADRVQALLQRGAARFAELGERLRQYKPRAVLTCARGSSDHAATYGRYLMETRLGVLAASASPSLNSVYGVRQDLSQCLFLAISQSGRSPDILAAAAAAKSAGALVVALVNVENSPLAAGADIWLPLEAGVESSVAATKSYLCTVAALLQLVAHWANDAPLLRAVAEAPAQMRDAWQLDWSPLVDALLPVNHLYVVGRGLGLGVAQEAALKLKETCALHAEAYSSAELRHGPIAIVGRDLPVLVFAQQDEATPGLEELAADLVTDGVPVLIAGGAVNGAVTLPTVASHPALAPLLLAQSFYRAAAELSMARGLNPDHPPRLKKVTQTV